MKMPWQRYGPLGRELRAARPKPPDELQSALEHEIVNERRRARRGLPSFRFGLAAATTALLLSSFAVAGGMAAASSSVRHVLADVAQVVHISSPAHRTTAQQAASPAADQYGRKKSCVTTAAARRTAALRAANGKLKHDLALATALYNQAVAKANKRFVLARTASPKLAAARRAAELRAAGGKYKSDRALAWKHHGQLVTKAKLRYRADVTKCPVT